MQYCLPTDELHGFFLQIPQYCENYTVRDEERTFVFPNNFSHQSTSPIQDNIRRHQIVEDLGLYIESTLNVVPMGAIVRIEIELNLRIFHIFVINFFLVTFVREGVVIPLYDIERFFEEGQL